MENEPPESGYVGPPAPSPRAMIYGLPPPPANWPHSDPRKRNSLRLAVGIPVGIGLAWFGILALYFIAVGLSHGRPVWDNELIRVSEQDDDGLCFVRSSQQGREFCYSFEEAPELVGLTAGDCARVDGAVQIEEAETVACPGDINRLVPEVPMLPAVQIGRSESRDLRFEFVEAESDFGRWCGGALVRENGVVVNQATYDANDTWWVCWGRRPEMSARGEPKVEVFEDFDALDEGALIMGWAPQEIAVVTIRDGTEQVAFDVTTTGGRFGTRMLTTPESWSISVSARSGEVWNCPWIPDRGVQCRN